MTIVFNGNTSYDLGRVDENIILSKCVYTYSYSPLEGGATETNTYDGEIEGIWEEEERRLTIRIPGKDDKTILTTSSIEIYDNENNSIFTISDNSICLVFNNLFCISVPGHCRFTFSKETPDTRFLEDFGTFLGDNIFSGASSDSPVLLDSAYRYYRIESVLEPDGELDFTYLRSGTGENIYSHYIQRTYSNLRISCEGIGEDNIRMGLRPEGGIIDILGTVDYIDFLIVDGKMKSKVGSGTLNISEVPLFTVIEKWNNGFKYTADGSRIEYLEFQGTVMAPSLRVGGEIVYQDLAGNPVVLESENTITFYQVDELDQWIVEHSTPYRNSVEGTYNQTSSKVKDNLPVYIFKWDSYSNNESFQIKVKTNHDISGEDAEIKFSIDPAYGYSEDAGEKLGEWFNISVSSPVLSENKRYYSYTISIYPKQDYWLDEDVSTIFAPYARINNTWISLLIKSTLVIGEKEISSFYTVVSPSPYQTNTRENFIYYSNGETDGLEHLFSGDKINIVLGTSDNFNDSPNVCEYWIDHHSFGGFSWWVLMDRPENDNLIISSGRSTSEEVPNGEFYAEDLERDVIKLEWREEETGIKDFQIILAYYKDQESASHSFGDHSGEFCNHWDVVAGSPTSRWKIRKYFVSANITISPSQEHQGQGVSVSQQGITFTTIGKKTLTVRTNADCVLKFNSYSSHEISAFTDMTNSIYFLDDNGEKTIEYPITLESGSPDESGFIEKDITVVFLYGLTSYCSFSGSIPEDGRDLLYFSSLDILNSSETGSYYRYTVWCGMIPNSIACTYSIGENGATNTDGLFYNIYHYQYNETLTSGGISATKRATIDIKPATGFDNTLYLTTNAFPKINLNSGRSSIWGYLWRTKFNPGDLGEFDIVDIRENEVVFKVTDLQATLALAANDYNTGSDTPQAYVKRNYSWLVDNYAEAPLDYAFIYTPVKYSFNGTVYTFKDVWDNDLLIGYFPEPKKVNIISPDSIGAGFVKSIEINSSNIECSKFLIVYQNSNTALYIEPPLEEANFSILESKINGITVQNLSITSAFWGNYIDLPPYRAWPLILNINAPGIGQNDEVYIRIKYRISGLKKHLNPDEGWYTIPKNLYSTDLITSYYVNFDQETINRLIGYADGIMIISSSGPNSNIIPKIKKVSDENWSEGSIDLSPSIKQHSVEIKFDTKVGKNYVIPMVDNNSDTVVDYFSTEYHPSLYSNSTTIEEYQYLSGNFYDDAYSNTNTTTLQLGQKFVITRLYDISEALNYGNGPYIINSSSYTVDDIVNAFLYPDVSSITGDYPSSPWTNLHGKFKIQGEANKISTKATINVPNLKDIIYIPDQSGVSNKELYMGACNETEGINCKSINIDSGSSGLMQFYIKLVDSINSQQLPLPTCTQIDGPFDVNCNISSGTNLQYYFNTGIPTNNTQDQRVFKFLIRSGGCTWGEENYGFSCGTEILMTIVQSGVDFGYKFLSSGSAYGGGAVTTEIVYSPSSSIQGDEPVPAEISFEGYEPPFPGTAYPHDPGDPSYDGTIRFSDVILFPYIGSETKLLPTEISYQAPGTNKTVVFEGDVSQGCFDLSYFTESPYLPDDDSPWTGDSSPIEVSNINLVSGTSFSGEAEISETTPSWSTSSKRLIYPLGWKIFDALGDGTEGDWLHEFDEEDPNGAKIELLDYEWIDGDKYFDEYKTEFVYNDSTYHIKSLENTYTTKEEYISQELNFVVSVKLRLTWPSSYVIPGSSNVPSIDITLNFNYTKRNG